MTESHQIRRKAAAIGGQPVDRATPLKAAQGKAVQEKHGWALSPIDVGDMTESGLREPPLPVMTASGGAVFALRGARTRTRPPERRSDRTRHDRPDRRPKNVST